jgi:hypothetical protein
MNHLSSFSLSGRLFSGRRNDRREGYNISGSGMRTAGWRLTGVCQEVVKRMSPAIPGMSESDGPLANAGKESKGRMAG